MSHSEYLCDRAESIFPNDLEEIVARRVIATDYPSKNTDIYTVPDYPHLIVRHDKRRVTIQTARRNAAVFNNLSTHGIDAVPYVPVEQGEEVFVVTLNVDGEPLDEIILGNTDDDMVERIDGLWARLSAYLVACKEEDLPHAEDIYTAEQYVYGTIIGDDQKRLWLVDLGGRSSQFNDSQTVGLYDNEIEDLFVSLFDMEQKMGRTLVKSRAALRAATELMINPKLASYLRSQIDETTESGYDGA